MGDYRDDRGGRNWGCLLLTLACLAIDALAALAAYRMAQGVAQFVGWLLTVMASA